MKENTGTSQNKTLKNSDTAEQKQKQSQPPKLSSDQVKDLRDQTIKKQDKIVKK